MQCKRGIYQTILLLTHPEFPILNNIMHHPRENTLFPRRDRILYRVEIERPHPRQEIHLRRFHEEAAFVPGEEFPEDEEGNHDGAG